MIQRLFLIAIATLVITGWSESARAQATAARLLFFNVKPGAKAQFEDAVKQQMVARRAHHTWQWLAWEYVTGEVPRYCIASFGHAWADFDQADETVRAEEGRLATAAALSSQPPAVQYFEHLDEVSDFGSATNTPSLAEVSVYQLHYGKTPQFYAALRAFHDALSRSGSGQRFEWFELRSGGDTPQFMLLVPRENWAAFNVSTADFQERLEKVLGKQRAAHIFDQFTSAVKSHQRSAVLLRPDLSLLLPPEEERTSPLDHK